MRSSLVPLVAALTLLACAPQPQPEDRAVIAARNAAAIDGFLGASVRPALRFCVAQQTGAARDTAALTVAGFTPSSSGALSKPIAGNVGNPPADGSIFVVLQSACRIRANGFSISPTEIDAAIAQEMSALGYARVADAEAGKLGVTSGSTVFRKGERIVTAKTGHSVVTGRPFMSIAIDAS
ncbi:hypothetical protein ACOI1H_13040 [Loktanella sp. DJP18]|uniref:hypothetical protein n=1 Tax=Loktanella sp. DJP18 TaxID=3409788 RepID=UPI003BB64809